MEAQKINEVVVKKNKKWIIPVVASAITVLVVAAVLIILLSIKSSGEDEKLQEQLDLGDKYLSELDYEQAIVAYEAAIEIDPMSADAYLGLASVYEAQGDYDKAIAVLEEGYLATADEELKKRLDEVRTLQINENQSEENQEDAESDSESFWDKIPEDAYTFERQITDDVIYVNAENLSVVSNETTGKTEITISGISIEDSYIRNSASSQKDFQEYNWSVDFYSESEAYSVQTVSWAYDPGAEEMISISDMQHSLFEFKEEEWVWSCIMDVEMQHTNDSITWIFYSTEDVTFDFKSVYKFDVIIGTYKDMEDRRVYILSDIMDSNN